MRILPRRLRNYWFSRLSIIYNNKLGTITCQSCITLHIKNFVHKCKESSASSRLGDLALTLDSDLHDLIERGLLSHDKRARRFDLHPIVRRYAYDRLAAPDRAAAHTRLRDYFAAVPPPDKVTRLEDLAPVIELYHHTLRAGPPIFY